jgi:peptidoglycan/LPS O-acetylase OafA/YrhL
VLAPPSARLAEFKVVRLGYRPAYDGVRALAVLAVLGNHGRTHLTGGFVGVDVFFVLSGFLITSLLLEEWTTSGSIDRLAFYGRRVRRLLPALAAAIVLVAILYTVWPSIDRGWSFGPTALAVVSYVGNWVTVAAGSSSYTPLGVLEHTWSLAIEEQFYIVWPLILIVCLRRRWRPGRLFGLLISAAVVSAALRAVVFLGLVGRHGWFAPYHRSDTRADGLALGCALAVAAATVTGRAALRRFAGPTVVVLAAAALIGVAALTLTEHDALLYLGGLSCINLAAVVIIAHVLVAGESLLTRCLRSRPLVWLGRRSYGLYLYHLPIFAAIWAANLAIGFWPNLALQVALSIVAAAASYRWIEARFLRGKRYSSKLETPTESFAGDVVHVLET